MGIFQYFTKKAFLAPTCFETMENQEEQFMSSVMGAVASNVAYAPDI